MNTILAGLCFGVTVGLLFTILIALVNILKYLREIRDLLQERQGD